MSIDWNEDYRDGDCKGGEGYSWFSMYLQARGGEGNSWFMVNLTSEHVPYSPSTLPRGIFLDTAPPENPTFIINNGGPTTDEQIVTAHLAHCDFPIRRGYQIKIWGDVDPDYNSSVKKSEEDSEWVAFTPTYLFKLSRYNGSKTLYAKIRDDVWNETEALVVTLTFTGGEEPPQPEPTFGRAADAPGFTSTPITGQDFEERWATEISVTRPVRTLISGSGTVASYRPITISASSQVSASRRVEFCISAERQEAARWNKLINEDEELLLNL